MPYTALMLYVILVYNILILCSCIFFDQSKMRGKMRLHPISSDHDTLKKERGISMTDSMEPATRVNEFTHDIMAFCESDPHLFLEMIRARENFLTRRPEKIYRTHDDEAMANLRFDDYFIYSYTSKHYQKNPLEVFLEKALPAYSLPDQAILQGFRHHIYSSFTVIEVVPGFYFKAKDLTTAKEYKVRENEATLHLKDNDYFIGRILPYETDYALSVVNLFLPDIPSYAAKRSLKALPADISREADPLMIEKELLQKNKQGTFTEHDDRNTIEDIEKKLKNYLKKRLGKKAPSIKSLRKKINRVTDPVPLIKELARMMHISSQEDFLTFQQLFYDFWNHAPRDEFQGKSPEEVAKGSMGPLEEELLDDFMNYMKKNMDITDFSNKDELEKAIKDLQRKWLHEPQEELEGKTPFQAMKEEREKIHSPRKDFPLSISIDPVTLNSQDPFDLVDIQEKDSPVVRDVETFVRYFQENRIKVTPKNRWIPFKHLKEITNIFINPGKDSFKFLGEEEKTGEEKSKLYIHFIHLLARAAKFIYHDKKGYIQVNHKRFKKFSEKSYGEKTIELMILWIEKVNWAELQPADHVKPYAREYQGKIVGLWHPFDHFKPNEKINSNVFTKEIYRNVSQEGKELEEIALALTPIVNGILIRYLKWFGALDIKEEKLHPKIEFWAIKEFWVTPKGKKLIDRVILDFWEKGKIKMNK